MRIGQQNSRYTSFIKLLLITAIVCIGGCGKKTPSEKQKKAPAETTVEIPAEKTSAKIANITGQTLPWRESLNEVISRRSQWAPILTEWYGKELAGFSLNDIDGNTHKLSDYRGKNVMIVLWATWCQPCLVEMPNIIALQNIISRDNLPVKILSISNENSFVLKRFINGKKINYTVISSPNEMLPSPINLIRKIPTTIFVDPEGKIKLIIQGNAFLGEFKAMVLAE